VNPTQRRSLRFDLETQEMSAEAEIEDFPASWERVKRLVEQSTTPADWAKAELEVGLLMQASQRLLTHIQKARKLAGEMGRK
jgi:hypothetical protein